MIRPLLVLAVALPAAAIFVACATPPAQLPARPPSTDPRAAPTETATAPATLAAAPVDPATLPKQARAAVIRAARLFDGKSDKAVQGGVTVLVENGLITKVGKSGSFPVPADADVIDVGDATILPGFIDAHTHLAQEFSGNFHKDWVDGMLRFPAEQAHYAASFAKRTLDAGFTTVRDLGASDQIDVGLRNAIAKGLVAGPRMLVAVHSISARGGHGDGTPFPPDFVRARGVFEGVCTGADQCAEAVRTQVKYGADVVKVHASGGVLSLADAVDAPQLTRAELETIIGEAHRLGKKAAAHCHGDVAARSAIEAGIDSIEHGSFLSPATLALMKTRGTVLVPTLLATDWLGGGDHAATFPPAIQSKLKAALKARSQMFKDALRIGVTIAFGTDSGVSPHGLNAREFALMTDLGMTPDAALRAATSVGARLLGLDAQIGTLEAGKIADVIAVPGNPLVDIHQTEHVTFVMRAGQIAKRP